MIDETLDSLYEELENDTEGQIGLELMPSDLVDPDELDNDDDENDPDFEGQEFFTEGEDNQFDDDDEDTGPDDGSQEGSLAETNIINDLLLAKGITDPKAIKYENEDGEIEEFDFYELPYEDQLQILKQTEDTSPGLSDHESEVVNFLRTQNATLDDVIAYVKREAIEEYERENSGKAFVVDDYKDEELFLMDLKLNYEDLTEEELALQLEKELEHEDLFKKKIAKIRAQYVDLEIKERETTVKEKEAEQAQEFETLSSNLIQAAVGLEDIGGINLEDNDKNAILSTILEKDLNGKTFFNKKLEDPQMLFKAAWFIEKGDEAFNMVHDYYKKQIDSVRKSAYEKGKKEATSTTTAKPTKTNFVRTTTTQNKPNGRKLSIDDL